LERSCGGVERFIIQSISVELKQLTHIDIGSDLKFTAEVISSTNPYNWIDG